MTSRISKPLSVFDKLGLRSKCRGEQPFSTQSGKKCNVTGGGMLRVGCNSSRISSMSAIEWPGWLKWKETAALPPPPPPRQGTAAVAFAWSGSFVACLRSLKRSRSVRLVSPIYCFFLHLLHWIIYVRFVEYGCFHNCRELLSQLRTAHVRYTL